MDMLRSLLGGLGGAAAQPRAQELTTQHYAELLSADRRYASAGTPAVVSNASVAGTYAGIERSRYPEFSSRIQISQEVIDDSRNQSGAFSCAIAEEWARTVAEMRQDFSKVAGIYDMNYHAWDPDMEMDIGL